MQPSTKDTRRAKRARAPIACYRCHHKKVRCDSVRPNCTRCLSSGILCAYPSSRRSRNTQPIHSDPFIHHLSQLEAKIQSMEQALDSQRKLVQSIQDSAEDWPVEKQSLLFDLDLDAMMLSLTKSNDPSALFIPDLYPAYDPFWMMENTV